MALTHELDQAGVTPKNIHTAASLTLSTADNVAVQRLQINLAPLQAEPNDPLQQPVS